MSLLLSTVSQLLLVYAAIVAQAIEIQHLGAANDTYDYIIVGGGTAGLVVANRLSNNPQRTILVVEYGYLDDNASILIPYNVNELGKVDMTNLTTAPLFQLGNITYPVNVGATVGGGSAVNGLYDFVAYTKAPLSWSKKLTIDRYFNRGSKSDYDAWESLGNNGWSWDDLLPYFRKHTNFTSPTTTPDFSPTWNINYWGSDGPVHASIPSFMWPQQQVFQNAMEDLPGIKYPQEGNDGSAVGVAWVPNSQDPDTQTRSSAKTAYYDPIRGRSNLHLLTGTKASKVLFHHNTAAGVQIISRSDAAIRTVRADKEVILAAGPIHSPNVLHHSGIGPRHLLEQANITVVHDLPGVGMNFQDTPTLVTVFDFATPLHPNPLDLKNATYKTAALTQYLNNHSGPLTQAHGTRAAFLTLAQVCNNATAAEIVQNITAQDPSMYLPTMYDNTTRAGYHAQFRIALDRLKSDQEATFELPLHGEGQRYIMLLQKPFSRGTVTMNTSDPDLGAQSLSKKYWSDTDRRVDVFDTGPLVDYNTLANPIDTVMSLAMLRFIRKVFELPALKALGPKEIAPGEHIMSDEDIIASFGKHRTLYPHCSHQAGTCSMMPVEMGGVVSSELLVYGVEKLSVVDSSVIPLLPGARLVSTVYAIAEKAADLIQSRT